MPSIDLYAAGLEETHFKKSYSAPVINALPFTHTLYRDGPILTYFSLLDRGGYHPSRP
jgi:hypothetical protein